MSLTLPPELVDQIICVSWSLPLSVDERISLMTTLPLVSSTWRGAYIRASSKDVHIPCESYWHHRAAIVRGKYELYDWEDRSFISNVCRSVTFAISSSVPLRHLVSNHPAANAIIDMFCSNCFHPNLRKVALHYHNISLDDVFKNLRLFAFPSQVNTLEITQSFSSDTAPCTLSDLRDRRLSKFILWDMPAVTHLTLEGVGTDYIADTITTCPNIRTLEITLVPNSNIFIPLPGSVEQVILHAPKDVSLSWYNVPRVELVSCATPPPAKLHVAADECLLNFEPFFILPPWARLTTCL